MLGNTKLNIKPCFSDQFTDYFDFILQVYRDDRFADNRADHKVLLPNKDINLFLSILKQEFGGITSIRNKTLDSVRVDYYNKDNVIDNVKCKEITVKLNKCKYADMLSKRTVYKTLCTYLRYLYEKPFNELLKKSIKAYRKDPSQHLLTYLYNSHKRQGFNSGHSIMGYNGEEKFVKFVPIKDTNFEGARSNDMVTSLSSAHVLNHGLTDLEYKQVKALLND